MIPRLHDISPVQQHYLAFLETLAASAFTGDISPDYANRTVLATDNSIYQVLPQGVIYPKDVNDLVVLTQLSHKEAFRDIVLSPRGGGTGTNGQSLTDGLIVDTSKYMNHVLEINTEERWVRVQCGVVKDQLNAAIKPYGLFFAPELSTSNRATIGGMINTDASGQGSCAYGKTRDHVLQLTTVLMDGSVLASSPIDNETLSQQQQQDSRCGNIYQLVDDIQRDYQDDIDRVFPVLNRCLTGYDLAHIRTAEQQFDINSILCGSEGTLGFIAEAKLNLLPIPQQTALINIQYQSFNAALRDAKGIMDAKPTSIETIDSKVLNLAKDDNIWETVNHLFPDSDVDLAGVNFVEYTADSEEELQQKMQPLVDELTQHSHQDRCAYTIAYNQEVKKVWAMRKKAVGLLGNIQGEARPIAFVEDTAVPPENLADFIVEFRALLESHQLDYGMFGHVDAGVLHVRPIIDMKDPVQVQLIRSITDQVVELTHRYGGLLWGEHGKGVRSEYAPTFFGELYPQLQRIKFAFDPYNQLNPGKIATPSQHIPLLKIDEVHTRGREDRKIDRSSWQAFNEGMFCNGNGACHNWDPNDAMCPSWKGTRQRTHTPKGRASLIREWLKQLSEQGNSATVLTKKLHQQSWYQLPISWLTRALNSVQKNKQYDFSHEVYESMSGCLACKSCVGQCPIKVDVPEFRSKFLELYYSRYLRPLKDYFVASLEWLLPVMANYPTLYNWVMSRQWVVRFMEKVIGLSDSPLLSTINFDKALADLQVRYAEADYLDTLTDEERQKAVIIVQDAFTRFFETPLLLNTVKLLQALGYTPLIAPFTPNGKPLHVHGFRKLFARAARNAEKKLAALAHYQLPLIGIEPSMTLAYRSEYPAMGINMPKIMLIQEWLATQEEPLRKRVTTHRQTRYLLSHCTERTNASSTVKNWQSIFDHLGHDLQAIDVGCCGMAGTYGHETDHVSTSKNIYALSWEKVINDERYTEKLLATGFSCRSQVKRFGNTRIPSPITELLELLQC